jgi:class 3 adenylate cyclase
VGLADDLKKDVRRIFREEWSKRDGQKVPEAEDLGLDNEAIELEATVLYADLDGSTEMVDNQKWKFAAEVYKTYLHCASKLIRAENGVITAFDGDRVMGVFIGGSKNTNAVRCGLKIKWAVQNIVNPAIGAQYPNKNYKVAHVVGVDTGTLRAARTGVRGANDLVWVGPAANYAAKLSSISEEGSYATYITEAVHATMNEEARTTNGNSMWEARTWKGKTIYRSSWYWRVD